MAKIKTKKLDYQLNVTAKMSFGEKLDEEGLLFFSRNQEKGLLGLKEIKRRKVEYIGPVGVKLSERLKKPISKYDFYFIVEQIIDLAQRIEISGLNIENLILDVDYVYINEVTKEVQFIYLPIKGKTGEADMIHFLESVIYLSEPLPEEDMDYISRFVFFLKSLKGFKPERIERFIGKEEMRVVEAIKNYTQWNSGFLTDKPMDYFRHYHIEKTGLLDEEETGLLPAEEETGVLMAGDATHEPRLYRITTGETIPISKSVFRIGKEGSYSDYTVTGNERVSRSHAEIIIKGNQYYVIDLNSLNRTYLNGRGIGIQEETPIEDGDIIMLADEEFIFHK